MHINDNISWGTIITWVLTIGSALISFGKFSAKVEALGKSLDLLWQKFETLLLTVQKMQEQSAADGARHDQERLDRLNLNFPERR